MYIFYGPTGVGKSDLALSLAKYLSAEIINMDVGQFYEPFSIGTAKPAWKDSDVPHHFFDIINEPTNFSVVAYRTKLKALVKSIRKRGNVPILVGGSGFYLKSLFFPLKHEESKSSFDMSLYNHYDKNSLWDVLYNIDPDRARLIHKDDTYRIKRALEIWHNTGQKPSLYKPKYCNDFNQYHIIHTMRRRDDLYERINTRTLAMLEDGWINEVKKLCGTKWETFISRKKLIGYNEILLYLQSGEKKEAYIPMYKYIQKRTRHYARRQIIFWRMFDRLMLNHWRVSGQNNIPITSMNLTSTDNSIYIKQLLKIHNDFTRKE